jgi:hypothetical protein
MYNLSNHYENIYQYLKTIITDPRVAYLHPFGSTQPENLEIIRDDLNAPDARSDFVQFGPDSKPVATFQRGPMFIFYDQEPLDYEYNKTLFDHITNNTKSPWVLVNTEQSSVEKDRIVEHYPFAELNYFFHIFAAADWYRGHEYIPGIIAPANRQLKKTYITFNRLTSNRRIYRSLLINELYKNNLLERGYVSYSKQCPDGGSFDKNLRKGVPEYNLPELIIQDAIANISQLPELRIDFADADHIPNQSMLLSPVDKLMESFIFLVTETCFFQTKTHLTEKVFKPIVLRMPFLLLGCAHNLEYLRSYGFKTFGDFWDESYDAIEDPIERIDAVVKILKDISDLSTEQQKEMLLQMEPILEHNYKLFNDPEFVRKEWNHLKEQLALMCKNYEFKPPYILNRRLGQAIPHQLVNIV